MIKGLHFVRKQRRGQPIRWYVYAWRGGPCIMRAVGPTKPKLTDDAIAAFMDAQRGATPSIANLLSGLILDWHRSPEWQALSPRTRKTWNSPLKVIEEKWGGTPLTVWSDPRMVGKVVQWRDSRADKPRAADIGITVLRSLLEFGRLRGRVSSNVAAGIPQLYRNGSRAEIVWTEGDIARFTETANDMDMPHIVDGLHLAALTGLRRADLVTVTWDQVGEFAIVKKALKVSRGKRRTASIPRIPALAALLEELKLRPRQPGVNTVLVNSFGRAWSGDGFGGSFNRVRDKAEIVHIDEENRKRIKKHLHDVRGTFCTKLIEAGLTNEQAADVMGWSPEQVAGIRRVYVDQSRVVVAIGERISGKM